MEYDHAFASFARVRRADIREGTAQRGRTAEGTLVMHTAKETLELIPPRAYPHLDAEIDRHHRALHQMLEGERLSMLRFLAGSGEERPRVASNTLRQAQGVLQDLEEKRTMRDAQKQAAWEAALEADRAVEEVAQRLAAVDAQDVSRLGAHMRERLEAEQRREDAWYRATVQAVGGWTDPGFVRPRDEVPVLRMRI